MPESVASRGDPPQEWKTGSPRSARTGLESHNERTRWYSTRSTVRFRQVEWANPILPESGPSPIATRRVREWSSEVLNKPHGCRCDCLNVAGDFGPIRPSAECILQVAGHAGGDLVHRG